MVRSQWTPSGTVLQGTPAARGPNMKDNLPFQPRCCAYDSSGLYRTQMS